MKNKFDVVTSVVSDLTLAPLGALGKLLWGKNIKLVH
jgi:hypothetical protein